MKIAMSAATQCFYEATIDARAFYHSLDSDRLVYFFEDGWKICGKHVMTFRRILAGVDATQKLLFLLDRVNHNASIQLCVGDGVKYPLTMIESAKAGAIDGVVDCCYAPSEEDIITFMEYYYW